jgi:hypothetical protein
MWLESAYFFIGKQQQTQLVERLKPKRKDRTISDSAFLHLQ